jgi:hypothetical protein
MRAGGEWAWDGTMGGAESADCAGWRGVLPKAKLRKQVPQRGTCSVTARTDAEGWHNPKGTLVASGGIHGD